VMGNPIWAKIKAARDQERPGIFFLFRVRRRDSITAVMPDIRYPFAELHPETYARLAEACDVRVTLNGQAVGLGDPSIGMREICFPADEAFAAAYGGGMLDARLECSQLGRDDAINLEAIHFTSR
jgi:hypothetical protein